MGFAWLCVRRHCIQAALRRAGFRIHTVESPSRSRLAAVRNADLKGAAWATFSRELNSDITSSLAARPPRERRKVAICCTRVACRTLDGSLLCAGPPRAAPSWPAAAERREAR